MSTLDIDAIAARLAAYEKFKNGGYIDRGNGVSQLEVAQRIQATNNLHTHAPGDIAALLAEVATLREALVKCVIPYEAILMDAPSRRWIAPRVWEAIEKAALAAREVLGVSRLTDEPK